MRALILLLASTIAIGTRVAHASPYKDPADTEGERRDGCPAGIRRTYTSTDPANLGPPPEIDSALAAPGFTFAARGAYFMSHRDDQGSVSPSADAPSSATNGLFPRARILTTIAHIHIAVPLHIGGSRSQLWHYTLSGTWGAARRWGEDEPPSPTEWFRGNTVIATGMRFNWLSSIDHADGRTIAGIRNAAAVQVYVGVPASRVDEKLQDLASHTPFEDQLFRPNWPWGVSGEFRVEMVGCYAAFAHLRADLRREDTVQPRPELVVPVTAAVGLNVSDNTVLTLQYGLIHYTDPGSYNVNAYHRLRFALDRYFAGSWRVAANIDVFSGGYEGMFLGLAISDSLSDTSEGGRFR